MAKQGVSAIIYDDMGEKYFLILHRNSNWEGWEFPKGGINPGEDAQHAAAREIFEETGLNKFKIVHEFEVKREFESDEGMTSLTVFLVQASMNIPVHIDKKEHDSFLWAKKDSVLNKLTWDNEKSYFKQALEKIK